MKVEREKENIIIRLEDMQTEKNQEYKVQQKRVDDLLREREVLERDMLHVQDLKDKLETRVKYLAQSYEEINISNQSLQDRCNDLKRKLDESFK